MQPAARNAFIGPADISAECGNGIISVVIINIFVKPGYKFGETPSTDITTALESTVSSRAERFSAVNINTA